MAASRDGIWDRFLEACRREGVGEGELRWYVVRVERYLKAHRSRQPTDHLAADVQAYLERAGREARLPAGLLWQLVHALRIFFQEAVETPWAADFQWGYWLASARALERDHPTIARSVQPIESSVVGRSADDGPFLLAALEQRVAAAIRLKNYSIRTEEAYVSWVRRFVQFHEDRDPLQVDNAGIARYLNHLALDRGVTPSTQTQALSALVFLYEHVLDRPVGSIDGLVAARRPRHLPTVLTREEVRVTSHTLRHCFATHLLEVVRRLHLIVGSAVAPSATNSPSKRPTSRLS